MNLIKSVKVNRPASNPATTDALSKATTVLEDGLCVSLAAWRTQE